MHLIQDISRSKRSRLAVARADVPAAFQRHDELRRRAEVPRVLAHLLRYNQASERKVI
jgi:hypothetical protein